MNKYILTLEQIEEALTKAWNTGYWACHDDFNEQARYIHVEDDKVHASVTKFFIIPFRDNLKLEIRVSRQVTQSFAGVDFQVRDWVELDEYTAPEDIIIELVNLDLPRGDDEGYGITINDHTYKLFIDGDMSSVLAYNEDGLVAYCDSYIRNVPKNSMDRLFDNIFVKGAEARTESEAYDHISLCILESEN